MCRLFALVPLPWSPGFSRIALQLVKLVTHTTGFCARLGIWHCKRMAGSCGRNRRHRPCFRAVAEYRSWFCVLSEPRENRHSESQANHRKSLHMGKRSLRPHSPQTLLMILDCRASLEDNVALRHGRFMLAGACV